MMDIFKADKLNQAMQEMRDTQQVRYELMILGTTEMADYYEQLKAKGFDNDQALKIVIAHGYTPGSCSGDIQIQR